MFFRHGDIFHPCQNLSGAFINKDALTSEVAAVDGYCVPFAVLCPILLCETYEDGSYEKYELQFGYSLVNAVRAEQNMWRPRLETIARHISVVYSNGETVDRSSASKCTCS